jgi:hypothetical protein
MTRDDMDPFEKRLAHWMQAEGQADPEPLRALPTTFERTRRIAQDRAGRLGLLLRSGPPIAIAAGAVALVLIAAPLVLRTAQGPERGSEQLSSQPILASPSPTQRHLTSPPSVPPSGSPTVSAAPSGAPSVSALPSRLAPSPSSVRSPTQSAKAQATPHPAVTPSPGKTSAPSPTTTERPTPRARPTPRPSASPTPEDTGIPPATGPPFATPPPSSAPPSASS